MGILSKYTNKEKEHALQTEIDHLNVLLLQKEQEVKKLKTQLNKSATESKENTDLILELSSQVENLNELVNQKEDLIIEIENLKKERTNFLSKIDNLLKRIAKKDAAIKKEQEIKSKYKYYFEHGAVDFSKAITFFNELTNSNLSETKVRTFLVQNNIIYKAGRYYAPTPYAEDFNYIVVYGEHGTTPPKYTFEFLLYLKQMIDEKLL